MMRVVCLVCGWVVVAIVGCPGPSEQESGASQRALGAHEVSSVDGVPITLQELEAVMEQTGLDAEEALRRLQDFQLLAAAGATSSRTSAARSRRLRQRQVQVLLADLEREVVVSDQEVLEYYQLRISELSDPDEAPPFSEVRPDVQRALLRRKKAEALAQTLREIEADIRVQRFPEAIDSMTRAELVFDDESP